MSGQPEPRWWRRQRDLALTKARDCKGRAAVALLELDTEQRSAFSHLEFIAGVGDGDTGVRLRAAWTPVSQGADDAIRAYLEATAHWDVDTDLELEEAAAAAVAFAGHADAMRATLKQIADYSTRFTDDFVRVTQTLEQLATQRAKTEQALEAAHEALERAEAGGLRARRGRELLLHGLERFAVVEQGPARHGLPAVLRACQGAFADAAAATAAVRDLPRLRDQVRTRTSSLRTRRSALQWRSEQGSDEVMRALRRDFVEGCSKDLEGSQARATESLDRADEEQTQATEAGSDAEQRWEDALAALGRARQQLDVAHAQLEAPRERLALLQAVAADPAASEAHARFVVRDTQKLLMAGPVASRHAAELDALAERLERTSDLLHRPHPNWLTYAHTLAAIVDSAHGLVVDIRASRAR